MRRIVCIVLAVVAATCLITALGRHDWWLGHDAQVSARIGLRKLELCAAGEPCQTMALSMTAAAEWAVGLALLAIGFLCLSALIAGVVGIPVPALCWVAAALTAGAGAAGVWCALRGPLGAPAMPLASGAALWLWLVGAGAGVAAAVAGVWVSRARAAAGAGVSSLGVSGAALAELGAARGGSAQALADAAGGGASEVRALLGLAPLASPEVGPPCARCAAPTSWRAGEWRCPRCDVG